MPDVSMGYLLAVVERECRNSPQSSVNEIILYNFQLFVKSNFIEKVLRDF